jgi:hypothetical protein
MTAMGFMGPPHAWHSKPVKPKVRRSKVAQSNRYDDDGGGGLSAGRWCLQRGEGAGMTSFRSGAPDANKSNARRSGKQDQSGASSSVGLLELVEENLVVGHGEAGQGERRPQVVAADPFQCVTVVPGDARRDVEDDALHGHGEAPLRVGVAVGVDGGGRRLGPSAGGRVERVEHAPSPGVQLRGFVHLVEEPVAHEHGTQLVADAVSDFFEVDQGRAGVSWRVTVPSFST